MITWGSFWWQAPASRGWMTKHSSIAIITHTLFFMVEMTTSFLVIRMHAADDEKHLLISMFSTATCLRLPSFTIQYTDLFVYLFGNRELPDSFASTTHSIDCLTLFGRIIIVGTSTQLFIHMKTWLFKCRGNICLRYSANYEVKNIMFHQL